MIQLVLRMANFIQIIFIERAECVKKGRAQMTQINLMWLLLLSTWTGRQTDTTTSKTTSNRAYLTLLSSFIISLFYSRSALTTEKIIIWLLLANFNDLFTLQDSDLVLQHKNSISCGIQTFFIFFYFWMQRKITEMVLKFTMCLFTFCFILSKVIHAQHILYKCINHKIASNVNKINFENQRKDEIKAENVQSVFFGDYIYINYSSSGKKQKHI